MFRWKYFLFMTTMSAALVPSDHVSDNCTAHDCKNSLYCPDLILTVVQVSNDSKSFLDRPLLVTPTVLGRELTSVIGNLTAAKQVIDNYSSPPGSDLLLWDPLDWKPRPYYCDVIQDVHLKAWAQELHLLWKQLGRQVSSAVATHPLMHSALPLPYPFILPGQHFREWYYWDSFWLMLGLLLGEMWTTAQHMMLNMASMIDRYGFVPSGGRVYYTERSHPPVLTQMVELYYNHTSNITFVEEVLPALTKEYMFWKVHRSVKLSGVGFVNVYRASSCMPRPESYLEDVTKTSQLSEEMRAAYYSEVASAAESGWPFSSRWLAPRSSSISTSQVIPVDLNAILAQNELTLYRLHLAVGKASIARQFSSLHKKRCSMFHDIFWSKEKGLWLDVDLNTGKHLDGKFYASSLVPLLWGCSATLQQQVDVLSTMKRLKLLDFPGGIPASLQAAEVQQQWDFPYAIAPLQWFPVTAWAKSQVPQLRHASQRIAQRWIFSTYSAWTKHHSIFGKYSCSEFGVPANSVETGSGWTAGVLLHFLSLYPDTSLQEKHLFHSQKTISLSSSFVLVSLSQEKEQLSKNGTTPSSSSSLGWVAAPVLLVVVLCVVVLCGAWCYWLLVTGEKRYWRRVQNEHLQAAAGGGGGASSVASGNTKLDSSEETDEQNDSDKKELFSWEV